VSFITPPLCDGCGDPLPSRRTQPDLRLLCVRCTTRRSAVDRARAIGAYDGTLRDLIHAMKYDGRPTLARQLGDLLARAGADLVAGADFAVPVPLHWTRAYSRGFNQAAELAARLPLRVVPVLARTRRTRAQAELDAARRHANVDGAFGLSWRARMRWARPIGVTRAPALRGATIVLVDDVSTTGATLEACASVLKDAGVREVRALTVARTLRTR
jgi:ComF family protein